METNGMPERAEVDFTAMFLQALAEAREAEAAKLTEAEEAPAGFLQKWKTSAGEIARINAGDPEAVNAFYFENYGHLLCLARSFYHRHTREAVRVIVSPEDMLQQVYIDLAGGLLKLYPSDKLIGRALCHSFRYAAVGGIDEIYIPRG